MNNLLEIPLGIDTENNVVRADIVTMPHCLIAGTTGSGKSNMLNAIICSLLIKTTPDDLSLYLFDSKMVELTQYEGIPNLATDVVTDAYEAIEHLEALVMLMEKRYKFTKEMGVRDFAELNKKLSIRGEKIPYILVVIDEVADLIMLSKHKVEESVVRIAQKARAVGIHLVIATQSPRREVVSGLLRANLPTKIAFSTSSALDSRIILGQNGAESLLNDGDMLYSDQGRPPKRIQAPFISSGEIEKVVNHWRNFVPEQEKIAA